MEWTIVIGAIVVEVAVVGVAYVVLPRMFKKFVEGLVQKGTAELAKEIRRLRYR